MERVRRLLAIANDPAASDNEQRIALEQAQRLMDKHAIEEWQLEENHDDVEITSPGSPASPTRYSRECRAPAPLCSVSTNGSTGPGRQGSR